MRPFVTVRIREDSIVNNVLTVREQEETADTTAQAQALFTRLGHTIDALRKGPLNSSDVATLRDVQTFLKSLLPKDEEDQAQESFLNAIGTGKQLLEVRGEDSIDQSAPAAKKPPSAKSGLKGFLDNITK